jgi:Zn-dependent protease
LNSQLMGLLKWAVILYAVYQGMRYLMVLRVFLVNGFRHLKLCSITERQLDPGMRELLTSLDESLAAAGFRHLGFMEGSIILTSYDKGVPCSVFVNDTLPAYAFVRPSNGARYSSPVELQIQTSLESGLSIATYNVLVRTALIPPDLHVGAVADAPVDFLVKTHQQRLALESPRTAAVQHAGLEDAIEREMASFQGLRESLRKQGWITATSNESVDRFTVSGAFNLARDFRRAIGARMQGASPVPSTPPTDTERRLRVEADMRGVLAEADNPQPVPGTPWPLILVAVATAVVSWVAAGVLFDFYYATLVLAIIAFHEAGHAIAMRLLGYRDVHVFFVPLLGALTLGRPATPSIRDRMLVLLAGPVPGLWLGLILELVEKLYYHALLLRAASLLLLLLNGLNLLPFTPLDGGRVLELLTRPESVWRIAVHVVSAAAILTAGLYFHDPIVIGLGAGLLAMLPQQWRTWHLRGEVSARAPDKSDFRVVARTTLEIITTNPRYASWQAATRVTTARAFGRSFADPVATAEDHVWGVIAYVSAWIPIGTWFLLRAG